METPSPPADPIVFVVDDEGVVRDTVSRMVREFGFAVETFASAEDFLRYSRPDRPACLVLDVMLGAASGFDVFAELAKEQPGLPTIFMTGDGTIPMSVHAMKAGAVEFLTKPLDKAALRAAIRVALDRNAEERERRAELAELESLVERLTPREREVLPHLVSGQMNKEIAAALGIAEQTIKVHRARILQKLEARSIADLVRLTERITQLRS